MRCLPIVTVLALAVCLSACAHKPPITGRPAATQRTNAQGIALIKEAEGLRLKPYRENNHWLVGYGHLLAARPPAAISQAQAESYLREDLADCEAAISRCVRVPVTSNEFSAMASLCYTVGTAAFAQSTLVDRLNAGDRKGAANQFLVWTKGTVKGAKTHLSHLADRRKKERALFLAP